jgi:hypothetical protein
MFYENIMHYVYTHNYNGLFNSKKENGIHSIRILPIDMFHLHVNCICIIIELLLSCKRTVTVTKINPEIWIDLHVLSPPDYENMIFGVLYVCVTASVV